MPDERTVILGVWTHLPAAELELYFASLRQAGYDGHVCLFTGSLTQPDLDRLGELADETIDVDAKFPLPPRWLRGPLRRMRGEPKLVKPYEHVTRAVARIGRRVAGEQFVPRLEYALEGLLALRHGLYLDYVLAHPEYSRVLISDVRDVGFQRDPFEDPLTTAELALEEPDVKVGVNPYNRQWIEDLYGDDGLREIGGQTVSCAGVTIGTRDAMIRYLSAMRDEVERHLPPLGPHDQGIHNWLLRHDAFGDVEIRANRTGRVLTMGLQHAVDVDADGVVHNDDGSVPAVLHQWDRHPELAEALRARWLARA